MINELLSLHTCMCMHLKVGIADHARHTGRCNHEHKGDEGGPFSPLHSSPGEDKCVFERTDLGFSKYVFFSHFLVNYGETSSMTDSPAKLTFFFSSESYLPSSQEHVGPIDSVFFVPSDLRMRGCSLGCLHDVCKLDEASSSPLTLTPIG